VPPAARVAAARGLPFPDRRAAGRELAARLGHYAGREDVLVLGLPRGGMPVAAEVAAALRAPLDVFVVRKLGVPGQEELALGAVASGGARVLNDSVVRSCGISGLEIDAITDRALEEVGRQERAYREGVEPLSPAQKTVIVVDDGLATGATMRVALEALRSGGPAAIVAAVPVAPAEVCRWLGEQADDVVCTASPEPFTAVGLWYRDFAPVEAEEVRCILRENRQRVRMD
jgi:predicted phosphoribosyltransferase